MAEKPKPIERQRERDDREKEMTEKAKPREMTEMTQKEREMTQKAKHRKQNRRETVNLEGELLSRFIDHCVGLLSLDDCC